MTTLVTTRAELPTGNRLMVDRMLKATRLQLSAWPAILALSWGVLLSAFVINLVIFAVLHLQHVHTDFTGGISSIYITTVILFLQLATRGFSFAVGFSFSRRAYAGSLLAVAVLMSAVNGVGIWLLGRVEDATGGWWVGLPFFDLAWVSGAGWFSQILIYGVPFGFLAVTATFVGAVRLRWGNAGLYVGSILTIVVGGLAGALITAGHGWSVVGDWLGGSAPLALMAGWPALLSLPIGLAAYLVLRRATPA